MKLRAFAFALMVVIISSCNWIGKTVYGDGNIVSEKRSVKKAEKIVKTQIDLKQNHMSSGHKQEPHHVSQGQKQQRQEIPFLRVPLPKATAHQVNLRELKGLKAEKWEGEGALEMSDGSKRKRSGQGELVQRGESRYLVQKLGGGTVCDLTGKERKVEVQVRSNSNGDAVAG